MANLKQYAIIAVEEDMSKGIAQINKVLKKMQIEEGYEIISIDRKGNMYDICYQVTEKSEETNEIGVPDEVTE